MGLFLNFLVTNFCSYFCGKFTVLDDVVISTGTLRFNREVCGEFIVLADVVVTSAHVTAIWLAHAS